MNKKLISIGVAAGLALSSLTGCGYIKSQKEEKLANNIESTVNFHERHSKLDDSSTLIDTLIKSYIVDSSILEISSLNFYHAALDYVVFNRSEVTSSSYSNMVYDIDNLIKKTVSFADSAAGSTNLNNSVLFVRELIDYNLEKASMDLDFLRDINQYSSSKNDQASLAMHRSSDYFIQQRERNMKNTILLDNLLDGFLRRE
ncbi:MAG: hypothetical protein ACMXYG_04500 [Candidatus Woesearchaeota archaeon]